MRRIATCLLTSMLAAGAGFAQTTPSDQKPILGDWGIETQFISKDIKPGDDFYRYVNEGWLQTATPPAGYPFSNAFVDATVRTQAQLRELIGSILASDPAPGTGHRRSPAWRILRKLHGRGPAQCAWADPAATAA